MAMLFVYGALRSGQRDHGHMTGATFRSQVRTMPIYRRECFGLYDSLVEGTESIDGELYEVDEDKLANIDDFQGVNTRQYSRRAVQLDSLIPGAQSYFYCGPLRPNSQTGEQFPITIDRRRWVDYILQLRRHTPEDQRDRSVSILPVLPSVSIECSPVSDSDYRLGHSIELHLTVLTSAHVYLFDIGTAGSIVMLWPNQYHPDSRIEGGRRTRIPTDAQSVQLQLQGNPGTERFLAIASVDPLLENVLPPYSGEFCELSDPDLQRIVQACANAHPDSMSLNEVSIEILGG